MTTEITTWDTHTRAGCIARTVAITDARIPARFRAATVTHPDVATWCNAVVAARKGTGPAPGSLLITGPTGVGKTYQAFGAIRRIAAVSTSLPWRAITAPDLYLRLQPRPDLNALSELDAWSQASLLLLDDLGVGKLSDFTERVNYQLINYRFEHDLPTIFTSNLPEDADAWNPSLAAALGDRVMSRIIGMTRSIVIKGDDLRRRSS